MQSLKPCLKLFLYLLSHIMLPFQHVYSFNAGGSSLSFKKFGLANATSQVNQSTMCRIISKERIVLL